MHHYAPIITDLLAGIKPQEIADKHGISRKKVYTVKYRYVTRTDNWFTPKIFRLSTDHITQESD